MDCCTPFEQRDYAKCYNVDTGKGMCTHAARNRIALEEDPASKKRLMRHFGFKKDLVLRAEHVFYHHLVRLVPRLCSYRRVLDETILQKLCGGMKKMEDPRPDYFHYHPESNMALLGEFDETLAHEDDEHRIHRICHHAGCGRERTFVFRVQGRLDEPEMAVCEKKTYRGRVFYTMTAHGRHVLAEVAAYVETCIMKMERGIVEGIEKRVFNIPLTRRNAGGTL